MNKIELVAALAGRTGLTVHEAELALNSTLDIITAELSAGGKVQLTGFGTFKARYRAPRTGRNPQKNLPVKIPAKRVPYFTPGRALKAAVNEKMR